MSLLSSIPFPVSGGAGRFTGWGAAMLLLAVAAGCGAQGGADASSGKTPAGDATKGAAPAAAGAPAGYAKPDLVIEPEALHKLLTAEAKSAPVVRVLDCRKPADHAKGHIPGAVSVDVAAWEAASKDAKLAADATHWGKVIGAAGVGADTPVVVLDDGGWTTAARVWWLLRYWGAKDVRILNGQHPAWVAAKLPLSTEPVTVTAVPFTAAAVADARLSAAQLADALGSGKACVLDVRTGAEYTGAQKKSARGGHIPGATHLDWQELLTDGPVRRILPAGELQKKIGALALPEGKTVAVHCQSGGRASVMVFALELLGRPGVANYYLGWSDWGNDESRPVEATPAKK